MSMLPRLKPDKFYDLVIEVASVRPGPIQGDMVHPYLRRRSKKERVEYPSPELERVLKKTLGVPLFQEQAMQIAIVGAGFPPDEADRLRRAMATFKRNGEIHLFRDKFIAGMVANDYGRDFATRCFDQIEGFGTYGFPESHAASFALLVYVSAWIKCFHPDVFACALLNSQPMGFYAPAQIVRDAKDHGVEVRPADVNFSQWDCTLEPLTEADGISLSAPGGGEGRGEVGDCRAPADTHLTLPSLRAGPIPRPASGERESLQRLPETAFDSYARHRNSVPSPRERGEGQGEGPSRDEEIEARAAGLLPEMPLGEHVVEDYATLGLTIKRHP